MRLFEWEGKNLWEAYRVPVPERVVFSAADIGTNALPHWGAYVVKAQTLSGDRAARQLIVPATTQDEALMQARNVLARSAEFPELDKVLVEQRIPHTLSVYVAVSYSTASRTPVLLLSADGGSGVETRRQATLRYAIDTLIGLHPSAVRQLGYRAGLSPGALAGLVPTVMRLWECFRAEDCTLAEINPLVQREDGTWCALDAKVVLDEDAAFRHSERTFAPRQTFRRLPTAAELAAWQIDKDDHRGVAGTSYIELDGDIGILASGGGASLACMDALIAHGGKPANYTEYSGNPPREKVRRLTQIVLGKPGLKGCWVVGVTANFTDIFETLSGFLEGLRTITPKPTYPILIRRAGPHDAEAFAVLRKAAKEEGYDFHVYGSDMPMIATAKMMVDLVAAYRETP